MKQWVLSVLPGRRAAGEPERLMGNDLLSAVSAREAIIALAVLGALMAMMGNTWRARGRLTPRVGKIVVRSGYALTWGALALFLAVVFWGR